MGTNATHDHTGQRYKNKKEMAAHWGIEHERLHGRLHTGWPLMDALCLVPDTTSGGRYVYKSFRVVSDGIYFPDGVRRYACTCSNCGKNFAMSVPEMEKHVTACAARQPSQNKVKPKKTSVIA